MAPPLEFGVFPRGLAGAPGWVAKGRRDDPAAIARALAELRGDGPPLLPRGYVNWTGRWLNKTALAQVKRIAEVEGPPPDLVLCYRDKSGDVAGWERFVTRVVSDYGHRLAAVQVTGEANLSGIRGGVDGAFPRAGEALVRGVLAAAGAKRAISATVAIGFAAAVQAAADPAGFWSRVRDLGGTDFAAALDYAGIDVYVDVFGPRVGVERVAEVVGWVLRTFREQTLRDANSSKNDMFYRFGVLRDDYSPKIAFGVLRDLIAELRRA